MNPIALAIPALVALIAVEAWVANARGRRAYRFDDTVANLGCGVSNQVISSAFSGALRTAAYVWVFAEYRVLDFDALAIPTWAQWALGILAVDFLYYWFHRATHQVGLLWAGHVVHHQSEDFNLGVALRQPWFIRTTALPLFLLLGVVGVPPHIYLGAIAASSLYQFAIHTELVGNLGPAEWVLNTPSHHRVHHAINAEYLDRNFGGMFIVWDRMFGTFAPERRRAVYGTVARVRSLSPLWANLHYYGDLLRRSRAQRGWLAKIVVWFAHPGWNRSGRTRILDREAVQWRADHKFSVGQLPGWLKAYLVAQLLVTIVAVVGLLLWLPGLDVWTIAVVGAWIAIATIVWSGLLEAKRWAWPVEIGRLVAGMGLWVVWPT